jgi:N6-L-threonylcarbamoyladenine synthase
MRILGNTLDDAAGEAFDKTGKMLGLPYPSGPVIDKLARQGQAIFTFPKPRIDGLDFSFSGLKTSIRYFLRDKQKEDPLFIDTHMNNICASVQKSIVAILLEKLDMAAEETGIREIAIAGGVSANSGLRSAIEVLAKEKGWRTYIPKLAYCTDNAAMIAITAHFKALAGKFADLDVVPSARMEW